MEAEQRAELVRRALNMVSMEQREVLVLKVYQGLKFIEIAEVLNEPLNTVKSRLYYGLTAMKKIFQEWKLEEIIINEM
jgi:RNA polymerase sigma-70 factor (ECF subfamily)